MSLIQTITINAAVLRQRILSAFENINSTANLLSQAYLGTDPNAIFESGTYKSTTVSLGSNPAVNSKPLLSAPTITSGEIDTDGLRNPYTVVNFQIDQQTVDGASVVAFKVYRQEVPAENLGQEVDEFNAADFDKLSQGTTRSGKFSADNKAQYTVDAFKTAQVNQNANLYNLQQTSNQQQLGATVNSSTTNSFPTYFPSQVKTAGVKTLVATINYQDAEAAAQLKQVYVQTKNLVTLSYTDHNVTYGTGYIYTITSFSATSEESAESQALSMVVLNLNGIGTPTGLTVKQVSECQANISVSIDPADLVKTVYVFRRNSEDLVFEPFAKVENLNNSVLIMDTDLEYLNSYTYRVILESIFGSLSEPTEVNITCAGQSVLNMSRSNNLQLPIILASQDQNSDGIKVSIFPNDPRVLYYDLERRNVTAGETVFATPKNKSNQFWPLNQFFVQQNSPDVLASGALGQIASGSLPAQSSFTTFAEPIEFVDNVVVANNYYQYRTAGYDRFGNCTGYGFAALAAVGKNQLRAPINFVAETLRDTPFRTKLTWQDDNQVSLANQSNDAQQKYLQLALAQANLSQQQQTTIETSLLNQDLSKVDISSLLAPYNVQQAQITAIQTQLDALNNIGNPLQFQLQRRLSGDAIYSSFPYTQNNFVIDEVPTPDAIPFSTTLDTGSYLPEDSLVVTASFSGSLSRSFGLPDFLQSQKVYQYRVAAKTLDGQTSDFSAPITVIASAQMSLPTNFSASVLNPNVTPCVVKLIWGIDPLMSKPDHWRIERRFNVATEAYQVIGNAYLFNEYFDRSAQIGSQYIYRIRSVSATGDESDVQEVSINT